MIDHAHIITLAARLVDQLADQQVANSQDHSLVDQQVARSQDHSLADQQAAHSQDQLPDQRQQVQQLDPQRVPQSLALKMLSHQRRALSS